MQLIGAAATDVNVLQSNTGAYRNEDATVNAGLTFSYGNNKSGEASSYSHMQIYNPTGSGIVGIVDEIVVSASQAGSFLVKSYDAELSALLDQWKATKLGDAEGNMDIRAENNESLLGVTIDLIYLPANEQMVISPKYPWIIPEDEGLAVVPAVTNTTVYASFRGREV